MRTDVRPRRLGTITRWGACLAAVLGAHAAAAMALLDWHTPFAAIASAPAILIDLAPAPAAPAVKPSPLPPGTQQPQTQASPAPALQPEKPIEKTELTPAPKPPVEKPEPKPVLKPAPKPEPAPAKPVTQTVPLPPAPEADHILTALPPPRPHVAHRHDAKPRHTKPAHVASLARAPSAATRRAVRSEAPAPGAARRDPQAVANWQSRLLARLERYKHYPDEAQARGEAGTPQIAFDVDLRGGVHDIRIVHSSGSSVLDHAALALPRRAAPLPPPPSGRGGRSVRVVVPIHYHFR